MEKSKIKRFLGIAVSVLVLALLLFGGYLILRLLGWDSLTREEVQAFVEGTGIFAPIVFIIISFVQVTIIPIPGAITILAGNYLFGAVESFIYSYIGMMLGAMFAFFLGRVIGRPFVDFMTGGKEKTDELIDKLRGRENVLLFFMFFLPLFPDDALCAVAGVLPISTLGFFLMQVVTRFTSILGTLLFMSGEIIPYHSWGLVILAILALVCIAALIFSLVYARQINDIVNKVIDKLMPRRNKKEENSTDAAPSDSVINDEGNSSEAGRDNSVIYK